MGKQGDDLEAVRALAATLEPFSNEDRERIIRWAREKLGMGAPGPSLTPAAAQPAGHPAAPALPAATTPKDVKSFIAQKNPRSDSQLAAVVAYYHQFVAPEAERKELITRDDLLDACRKAERPRPRTPQQTMVNAYTAGLLDRAGRGSYRLNAVGENLVAMVLPDNAGETQERRAGRPKSNKKPKARRAPRATRRPRAKRGARGPLSK